LNVNVNYRYTCSKDKPKIFAAHCPPGQAPTSSPHPYA
jgi:hypothetical protein